MNRTPGAKNVNLPPLEHLRVFEAAARLGNFTAAALELNLTQATVSQRIKILEEHLGTQLFERQPRGVTLTLAAEAFVPHVRSSFSALSRAAIDVFGSDRRRVAIAAPGSAILLWIIPRLDLVNRNFPNTTIRFVTVYRDADYETALADFDVRFGYGGWPGRVCKQLFPETLAPVASPELARYWPNWREAPFISLAGPRKGWHEWAVETGSEPPSGTEIKFDSFLQVRDAALRGLGVMLGSLALLEDDLRAGRLLRLNGPALSMRQAHWLTWAANDLSQRQIAAFCSALMADEPQKRQSDTNALETSPRQT